MALAMGDAAAGASLAASTAAAAAAAAAAAVMQQCSCARWACGGVSQSCKLLCTAV